jgi:predicted amidophosphoribosyltransferase
MSVTAPPYGPAVLDLLFPLDCPGCGARGAPACRDCLARVRPAPPAPAPDGLDDWVAAFAYEGVIREVVARVKYRNARAAVPWLAAAVAAAASERGLGGDVVTWAPTTTVRRRHRGFDPAEVLARAVARRLSLPTARLLDRMPGPPQTGLPASARRAGPRFAARRRVATRVVIVDDVATTGATLSAAAAALRDAGAADVVAVTAARTPPPRARHDRAGLPGVQ